MSFNPIIRGFNVISKLVTRGYAELAGRNVKICRLYTRPHTCQTVKVTNRIQQLLSTNANVCQSVDDQPTIIQKLKTKTNICQSVKTE